MLNVSIHLPPIEAGIPLPTPIKSLGLTIWDLRRLIHKCRRRDSFFIPTYEPARMQVAVHAAAKAMRTDGFRVRIVTRSAREGRREGLRVWRTR